MMEKKMISLLLVLILPLVCFAQDSKQAIPGDKIQQDTVWEDIPFVLKEIVDGWKVERGINLSQVEGSLKFTWIVVADCGYSEDDIKIKYTRHSDSELEIRAISNPYSPQYECLFYYEIEGEIDNLAKGDYSINFIFEKGYTTPIFENGYSIPIEKWEKLKDGSFRYKGIDIIPQYQIYPTVKKEFTIE